MNKFLWCFSILVILLFNPFTYAFAEDGNFYLRIIKDYSFFEDGSSRFHCHKEFLINDISDSGSFVEEWEILYNNQFQSVCIHEAYSQTLSGERKPLSEDNLYDTALTMPCSGSSVYPLRKKIVRFSHLSHGQSIILDYSVYTEANFFPVCLDECLTESELVKELEINLSLPTKRTFPIQLYGSPSRIYKEREGLYHLKLYNIPAQSTEPLLPSGGYGQLRLIIGEEKLSWNNFFNLHDTTEYHFTPEESPWDSIQSDRERALAIAYDISKAHKLLEYPLSLTGFSQRPLKEAFASQYVTQEEKCLLLCRTLLKDGFQAGIIGVWPSYINRKFCHSKNVKCWLIRIKLKKEEKDLFIDARTGEEYHPERYTDTERVLLTNGEQLSFSAEPLTIRSKKSFLVRSSQQVGSFYIFTLPHTDVGADGWNLSTLTPRIRISYLELPSMIDEEDQFILKTGKSLKWVGQEDSFVVSKPLGIMTQNVKRLANGDVHVTRRLRIFSQLISPQEYPSLRCLLEEWSNPSKRVFLFEKANGVNE